MDSEKDKATQRFEYRKRRDDFVSGLSEAERAIAFSQIPSPLKQILAPGKIVAAYIAKDSEADPSAILAQAIELGCKTALPHVTGKVAPMRFLRWSPGDELVPGPFGLRQPREDSEPCEPDVVLVPLVAFDSRLMRLGQGAGHYDRALSILENVFSVGIAWSVQIAPALVTDPWDMPLDAVLTEQSWISL